MWRSESQDLAPSDSFFAYDVEVRSDPDERLHVSRPASPGPSGDEAVRYTPDLHPNVEGGRAGHRTRRDLDLQTLREHGPGCILYAASKPFLRIHTSQS